MHCSASRLPAPLAHPVAEAPLWRPRSAAKDTIHLWRVPP